ncbi:hypothetical protein PMAYCL1PPCAC_05493, partial [Pristionchus mayeri]
RYLDMRLLPLLSALFQGSVAMFGLDLFTDGCCTTPTTTTTTTEDPCPTTNGYNAMGWETDEGGNVWIGEEGAKLYLVMVSDEKYWKPLPKDWPEAEIFGSQFPDSPNYHGPCPYPCGCTPKTSEREEMRKAKSRA